MADEIAGPLPTIKPGDSPMSSKHLALALVAFSACSDSAGPEEPIDLRVTPASLAIVGGMGQADSISALLADAIRVELVTEADPTPIPGVIVNFVVVEPNCGRPFAGSALTDSLGRAADRWELGTKAGTCTMEVRAVDSDGTPRVFASTTAMIRPGAAHTVSFNEAPVTLFVGQALDTTGLASALDRAGNPLTVDRTGRTSSDIERTDTLRFAAGGREGQKSVTWLADLRKSEWTLTGACSDPSPDNALDSLVATMTADTVRYIAPGETAISTSGTWTQYSPTGAKQFTAAHTWKLPQVPGSLGTLNAESNPPTAYSGSLCGQGIFEGFGTTLRPTELRVR